MNNLINYMIFCMNKTSMDSSIKYWYVHIDIISVFIKQMFLNSLVFCE